MIDSFDVCSHCGPDIKSEDYLHLPGNDIEELLRQSEDVKPIIALATVGLSIEESSRQSPLKGIQVSRYLWAANDDPLLKVKSGRAS